MERYSLIHTKLPREFVLLQGTGCRWGKCTFCDYHTDSSNRPFEVNEPVLRQVTGQYGVLDVINSGSAMELDAETIELIKQVVSEKHIHTLWFEAHYMYRHELEAFAQQFAPTRVKFRCGVETFDADLRRRWRKGIPASVTAEQIAEYFQGVCLLCCTEGEEKEHIVQDIALARQHFEYLSINLFCNNTTPLQRDNQLAEWFIKDIYPTIQHDPHIEILLNNTDLGVG
ncbi:MAG: radical SAM protein [Mediterranea massiliensis]|nr:radical SAM protein [Mediterranea massiliensis]